MSRPTRAPRGDKSYVSLGRQCCPVCGTLSDSGEILLDTRLRDSLASSTVTGWGLCPLHQQQHNDGYVFLVGVDPEKSGPPPVKLDAAYRTGEVVAIRRAVWPRIFNVAAPEVLCFCDPEVVTKLQGMLPDGDK